MYTLKFLAVVACLKVDAPLLCLAQQNGAADRASPAQVVQWQLAESNLGWCYKNGRGVPKDLAAK